MKRGTSWMGSNIIPISIQKVCVEVGCPNGIFTKVQKAGTGFTGAGNGDLVDGIVRRAVLVAPDRGEFIQRPRRLIRPRILNH